MQEQEPAHMIVNLKLPNKRFYDIAWSIALLKGYESLDEFVTDCFIDRIEMYPEGRDNFDGVQWGFKTREELEKAIT
jgi:hypothetical protein